MKRILKLSDEQKDELLSELYELLNGPERLVDGIGQITKFDPEKDGEIEEVEAVLTRNYFPKNNPELTSIAPELSSTCEYMSYYENQGRRFWYFGAVCQAIYKGQAYSLRSGVNPDGSINWIACRGGRRIVIFDGVRYVVNCPG